MSARKCFVLAHFSRLCVSSYLLAGSATQPLSFFLRPQRTLLSSVRWGHDSGPG